jgi:hypothetical protein
MIRMVKHGMHLTALTTASFKTGYLDRLGDLLRELAIIGTRTKDALATLRVVPFRRTALIGESDAPKPNTGGAEPVVLV